MKPVLVLLGRNRRALMSCLTSPHANAQQSTASPKGRLALHAPTWVRALHLMPMLVLMMVPMLLRVLLMLQSAPLK